LWYSERFSPNWRQKQSMLTCYNCFEYCESALAIGTG
jgi:hypothetical protein